MVEHVEKIVDMRRHQVLEKGEIPRELEQMFRNLEVYSDPWGYGPARRMEWAAGLGIKEMTHKGGVDIVYWVGCSGAFDERYRSVVTSTARILGGSGIEFGVLGPKEFCCGDFARRAGNEFLFLFLARKNMAILEEYGVKKILTSCPHCYHVLRNEYPGTGAGIEIVHHSEFLLELVDGNKVRTSRPVERTISYHDSCYLGRYNGIFDPPRRLLSKIPGVRLVEAGRRREDGFCCGAGGGNMWLVEQGDRINERRAAELRDLKPDIVATACPHCLYMLEDGMNAVGEGNPVPESLDIAEIMVRSL
jgi:Fe-S oxidoreductase